jgi:hypothetical protein
MNARPNARKSRTRRPGRREREVRRGAGLRAGARRGAGLRVDVERAAGLRAAVEGRELVERVDVRLAVVDRAAAAVRGRGEVFVATFGA